MPRPRFAAQAVEMFGVAVVIMVFVVATPLDREEPLSEQEVDFRHVFGLPSLDEKAQIAVDNYFKEMLKVACMTAEARHKHLGDVQVESVRLSQQVQLERAQESAEVLSFDVPLKYKEYRYGGSCTVVE